MNTDLLHAGHHLPKGGLFRIHDGRGQRIECLAGCLWLTQERDPRDIILQAGEGFTLDRDGDTYLSALDESRFVLLELAPRAAAASKAAAAGERVY